MTFVYDILDVLQEEHYWLFVSSGMKTLYTQRKKTKNIEWNNDDLHMTYTIKKWILPLEVDNIDTLLSTYKNQGLNIITTLQNNLIK
jgi:hypothetical protein